jgi:hypothetical protein
VSISNNQGQLLGKNTHCRCDIVAQTQACTGGKQPAMTHGHLCLWRPPRSGGNGRRANPHIATLSRFVLASEQYERATEVDARRAYFFSRRTLSMKFVALTHSDC